jgi:hypothetical protein
MRFLLLMVYFEMSTKTNCRLSKIPKCKVTIAWSLVLLKIHTTQWSLHRRIVYLLNTSIHQTVNTIPNSHTND